MTKRRLLLTRAGSARLVAEFDHTRRLSKVARGQSCREKKDSLVACNLMLIFCAKCLIQVVSPPVLERSYTDL